MSIEYGELEIDNPDDLYGLRAHYQGDKVMVTVMREEKITKVTLEAMVSAMALASANFAPEGHAPHLVICRRERAVTVVRCCGKMETCGCLSFCSALPPMRRVGPLAQYA